MVRVPLVVQLQLPGGTIEGRQKVEICLSQGKVKKSKMVAKEEELRNCSSYIYSLVQKRTPLVWEIVTDNI